MKKKIFTLLFLFLVISASFCKDFVVPFVTELFVFDELVQGGQTPKDSDFTGQDIIIYSMIFGLTGMEDVFFTADDEFSDDMNLYNSTLNTYRQLCDELEAYSDYSEMQMGEKILELMYEKVLKQYSLPQTKVDVMFHNGKYNCVTTSLLYLALAVDCGLDARVQETEKHAFITLYLSDGTKVDVETTNPYGFNPGAKKEIGTNTNGSKKYAIVPKNYYANRKEISRAKAITLPAKNICSVLNDQGDFEYAIPLAASILSFVTKEKTQVRNDFDALCGNFTIAAVNQGRSEDALDFLENVFSRYGKSDFLVKRYSDITYNSVAECCNKKDFSSARSIFVNRCGNVDDQTMMEMQRMIYQGEVLFRVSNLSGREGIKVIQEFRNRDEGFNDVRFINQLEKIEENHWATLILDLFDTKEYLAAAKICDEGLESLPKSTYLKNTRKQCYLNHGIDVHNQIVPLVNAKKYSEALKIVKEALKVNPDNATLKSDMNQLEKMMKR